jgi:hypothetical protein
MAISSLRHHPDSPGKHPHYDKYTHEKARPFPNRAAFPIDLAGTERLAPSTHPVPQSGRQITEFPGASKGTLRRAPTASRSGDLGRMNHHRPTRKARHQLGELLGELKVTMNRDDKAIRR